MKKFSLTALARRHLGTARHVSSGRSANTVYGGHEHVLRQTVIALIEGRELNEHLNPGEATVFVLHGRIRLATEADRWEGIAGDLIVAPADLYSVEAVEDSVVLLTVAKTDREYRQHDRGSAGHRAAQTQHEGTQTLSGPEPDHRNTEASSLGRG
ncbi:cupin domain-containing protein [Kocuria rosea]|uniref:cupin domain-containing protein n=1 Tax=Kocuria rosea TaxID=1275 RepID=UPI002B245AFA|nr:cupin domain-containing protein [Kocuria rosea]MEB2528331.1 cupin domain-containing protein [Kocuria rosea]MEB2617832.1 cupin domain-containing protein [Kocuria rosea]